jgi:branched-chain amino acid transport system permease protein
MSYLSSLIIFSCVNIIAVSGLVLLTGFSGIFSIGHAGFMAIGGYTAVVLYMNFGIPFLITIFLGGIASVIISIIIGYPALRNRMEGDSFAIAMLGFVAVVRISISNIKPVLNGAMGISGIERLATVPIVVVFTIFSVFLMRNFLKSNYGVNCTAVQQQEIAAEMVGVDILKTKLTSLMLSAFYAGVAGGLFAFFTTYISPETFAEAKSDDLLAAVVLGGINSLTGPLVAAVILVILPEMLRFLAIWRLVFYGLSFVIIMRFKPEGLYGYKELSFNWIKKLLFKGGENNER